MPAHSDHPLNLSGIGDLLASLPKGPRTENSNGLGSAPGNIPTDVMSPDSSFVLLGPRADVAEDPPPASLPTADSQKMLEPPAPAQEAKCRSCGNTGLDFMGQPCSCVYGQRVRQEARAAVHSNAEDAAQDPSPATLLPPPMPISAAVAWEACWAQPGTPRGRATPPRTSPQPDQQQLSSSASPWSRSRSGRLMAVHAAAGSAPSAFEWRLPLVGQLPGAPQFGSPSVAGSIVHRMPADVGGSVSPRFHPGHKVQANWAPGAQGRIAWSPNSLSSDTPGSVSSVMSMMGASAASTCTPPRGRPRN